MNIRWRLLTAALQVVIIGLVTAKVTGGPFSADLWFLAGLVLITVHPLFFEPYYAKPPDVAGNSLVILLLYFVASKTITRTGWDLLAIAAVVFFALALFALVAGAGRKEEGRIARAAQSARAISGVATARRFYSAVFLLSLWEQSSTLDQAEVWWLIAAWLAVLFVGRVNWQSIWSTVTGTPPRCDAEGMIGPSRLLVASTELPQPGSWVSLRSGSKEVEGVVITRIRRSDDVWAQIHISDQAACEGLLGATGLTIRPISKPRGDVVGAVDVGSSDMGLRFVATRELETGKVIAVRQNDLEILYQISGAEIQQSTAKGGSHLVVRVDGTQLGHFESSTLRLRQHRWVPTIGSAVLGSIAEPAISPELIADNWIRLGRVLGTEVPVFLDLEGACQGHLVILGMTKMGKTSLAVRLANALGKDQPVVILDQTREYVDRRGLPKFNKDEAGNLTAPGISVLQPPEDYKKHPAVLAHAFLKKVVEVATQEYVNGETVRRALLIDEAHQFVPEPAGMGFNAPGRDSSTQFGLLMMQVRKYGISIVLVSQRTAVVSKSALSQCENFIAFRYVDQTGLEYLETVAGLGARRLVPKLEQGEALVFGPAMSADGPVAIDVDWDAAALQNEEPVRLPEALHQSGPEPK